MMQQSSAPCFCLPFFGKKKGYSGRKDKKRTVWDERNDKPPPALRFFYIARQFHRLHTVTPVLGEKAAHNGRVVYSLDFEVTPHQLRHTYITNLIHSSVDPKTVQYLAGHESSKITMDIYAKVKYNRPDQLVRTMGSAFAQWEAV